MTNPRMTIARIKLLQQGVNGMNVPGPVKDDVDALTEAGLAICNWSFDGKTKRWSGWFRTSPAGIKAAAEAGAQNELPLTPVGPKQGRLF